MGFRVSFREHRQSDGTKILYARFRIPVRQEDGSIRNEPTERSTRTGKRVDARREAELVYQKAYEDAHRPRAHEAGKDTFAAAAVSYMRSKGSKTTPVDGLIPASRLKVRANKSYLIPIIERIGTKKLHEISQAVVDKLCTQIYPGRTAQTINRQLYTPIIAVLNHVKQPHALKRPEGHDSLPAIDVPVNDWYPPVLRVANPYLRAFLLTQRLHGRRPDELLNRTREHFDDDAGVLLVWDGKGEQFIAVQLAQPALIAIRALPDLRLAKKGAPDARLTHAKRHFLYGTNRKETMRGWLLDACKEAGVRYHMAKEAGRHAFVTKNLQEGKSLKWVQDGGRWKTLKVVAEKYGHLERQEVDRQARESGEKWFKQILSQPGLIEGQIAKSGPGRKSLEIGGKRGDGKKKRA